MTHHDVLLLGTALLPAFAVCAAFYLISRVIDWRSK